MCVQLRPPEWFVELPTRTGGLFAPEFPAITVDVLQVAAVAVSGYVSGNVSGYDSAC